jgi:hypothetical protein
LAAAINAYGTGGGTGGALNATWDAGTSTVTVVNMGGTPATGATQTLTLNIDLNVTVLWNASLAGTASASNSALVNLTGAGIFEIADGSLINQTSGGNSRAIFNGATGAVNVTGGEVRATTGVAIFNNLNGVITVSGGLVSSACENHNGTIHCNDSNTDPAPRLIVTGGTIENTSSSAAEASVIYQGATYGAIMIEGGILRNTGAGGVIHANKQGMVKISETDRENNPTLLTCSGINQWRGATIYLQGQGSAILPRLIVEGGTIENNSTNTDSKTIRGDFNTGITIFGGTIIANKGVALHGNTNTTIEISEANSEIPTIITSANSSINNGTIFFDGVSLNITGGLVRTTSTSKAIHVSNVNAVLTICGTGTVFGYGSAVNHVITHSNFAGATEDAAIIAWDREAGNTVYISGSSTDIFSQPAAIALWQLVGGIGGIYYSNGNNAGFIDIAEVTVDANDVAPIIITTTLPNALLASPYSATLLASGGIPMTWTLEAGDLPDGISMSAVGILSGTPTQTGSFPFTVKVTNSAGNDAKELQIDVVTMTPPIITTSELPIGLVGDEYHVTLAATGGVPIVWALESGNLPNGVSLSPDGVISGIPTEGGVFTFTVSAENDGGYNSKMLNMNIINCLEAFSDFPLTEGFENNGLSVPWCWENVIVTGVDKWQIEGHGWPPLENGGAYKIRYWGNAGIGRLITPKLDFSAAPNPMLKYWYRLPAMGGGQDELLVYYKSSNSGEWVLLKHYNEDIVDWREETILLPNSSSEYYVAFEARGHFGAAAQLDNVSIENFATANTPGDVTNLTITPSEGNEAVISWTNPTVTMSGEPLTELTSVKIYLNDETTPVYNNPNPVIGGDESGVVTFTTHETYKITVAGENSAGEGDGISVYYVHSFPWTEGFEGNGVKIPISWTNELIVGIDLWKSEPHAPAFPLPTGGASLALYWGNGGVAKLITPRLNLSATEVPVLKFMHLQYPLGGSMDEAYVYYKTSLNGTWNLLASYTENTPQWTERMLPLPEKSNDYYIAFEAHGHFGGGVKIDNVTVENSTLSPDPPVITTASLPDGRIMQLYDITLQATGTTPITWSIINGSLPTGLSLNTTTGKISGMPRTEGAFNFTVKAANIWDIDSKPLTIIVDNHYPVVNPVATIVGNDVVVTWENPTLPQSILYRYDSGINDGQIGFQGGTALGIIGSVHKVSAELTNLSWFFTTDAMQTAVDVFVLGITDDGKPDRNNLLYTINNIPNTPLQWCEYYFPEPVSAPNGFFIGLSPTNGGFLSLGTDAPNAEYPFQPNTHFYSSNYTQYDFSPFEQSSINKNAMIRAEGMASGKVVRFGYTAEGGRQKAEGRKQKAESNSYALTLLRSYALCAPQDYTIYRLNQGAPENDWMLLAGNLLENNYLENDWQNLTNGFYQWAIKANYATGQSEAALSNVLEKELNVDDINLTAVTLYPNPFTNEIYIDNHDWVKNVQIMSVYGQKIKEFTLSGNKFTTSELPKGVYFIIIENFNGEKSVHKMVKM